MLKIRNSISIVGTFLLVYGFLGLIQFCVFSIILEIPMQNYNVVGIPADFILYSFTSVLFIAKFIEILPPK